MGNKIKFKRGSKSKLPERLAYGEPAFVSDEGELYIGTESGNIKLTSKSEINKINKQLDNMEINPCIFGAKGDGVTNDTIAILTAIKYAKGRKIKFNNGVFLVDYFALSGDKRKPEYIDSDTLNIEGSDSTIIKMNGFINSEPPSYNLGINFGYEPSIFSLNCFNKITIKNITLKGCLFDNLEEDTKAKTETGGTLLAYNTRVKCISATYSKNIYIDNVKCSENYSALQFRDCENLVLNNIFSFNTRACYMVDGCNNVYLNNVYSTDARFELSKSYLDDITNTVYNADGLVYKLNPNSIANYGFKLNQGYGFVLSGSNITLNDCYSIRSASECFRIQTPTTSGKAESSNITLNNCKSIESARYGFSVRTDNVTNLTFNNCHVEYCADIDVWYGEVPHTLQEAQNSFATKENIETYWAFRLCRTSNGSFYASGKNTKYINCSSTSKETMYENSNGNSDLNKKKSYYLKEYQGCGLNNHFIDYSGEDNIVILDNCIFKNPTASKYGSIRTGYKTSMSSSLIIKNCVIDVNSSYYNQFGLYLGGDMSKKKLSLINNKFEGGYANLYFENTSAFSNFISKNNIYSASRSPLRINSDIKQKIIFQNDFLNGLFCMSCKTLMNGFLFNNCQLNYSTRLYETEKEVTFYEVYFKEGSEYFYEIDAETNWTGVNTLLNGRYIIYKNFIVTKIIPYTILSSNLNNLKLLKSIHLDSDPVKTRYDVFSVYNLDNEYKFQTYLSSGGTNLKQVGFSVTNDSIKGRYRIYFTLVKNGSIFVA